MNNITKQIPSNIFLIAVIFYIWHTTVPVLGFYTPAVLFAACILFLYGYILVLGKLKNRIFAVLLILNLYFLGLLYSGTDNFVIKLYQILQMGLYPILIIYISDYCNRKFIKYLLGAVLFSYILTAVTTYIGCGMYPGAARTLALPESEMGSDVFAMYKIANIGNLTFTYSLVLLIPQIVFIIKSRIMNRLMAYVMLVILTLTILRTEYTTALLLMLICYLLFLLPFPIRRHQIVFFSLALLMILLIGQYFLVDFLIWLSSSISSETMMIRLKDLASVIQDGMDSADVGDFGSRMELYGKSIQSFYRSPVWGGESEIGGHSLFFDSLARFGLLGLTAFIITYKKSWDVFYKPFANMSYYPYLMFSYILVIVMAILNPKDNLGVLTFTIPLFALYYNQKYENTLDR